jgi:hypothetical protein
MGDFLIQTENGYTIGDVLGEGNSYSDEEERERWYNARLIAAAPDMLEALQELYNADWANLCGRAQEVCEKAIAKATGQDR